MAFSSKIQIPAFQHFDCQGCGHCCGMVVNLTETDRRKIIRAGWLERYPEKQLFIPYRMNGRRLYRLAKQADGRCIFMSDDGRCRLQAESGYETKPRTCRMFPFMPTPGVNCVRINLRGDCPSVACNHGRPLHAHSREINRLVQEAGLTPTNTVPEWRGGRRLIPVEFEALAKAFEDLITTGKLSNRKKLQAICLLLDFLYTIRIRKIQDARFLELMELLTDSVLEEVEESGPVPCPENSRTARLFRQWLFLHAVSDDPAHLDKSWLKKMVANQQRYWQSRKFSKGIGQIPPLAQNDKPVDFSAISTIKKPDDESLDPLIRSMRLKLEARAFAGPAYFNYDVLSGLTAWALLPALVGWFARMEALMAGESAVSAQTLLLGLQRAHWNFGVIPSFGRISERLRFRALGSPGIPGSLMARYDP